MIEVTVILKDEETTFRKKFLHYTRIDIWHDSDDIKSFIKAAADEVNRRVDELSIDIQIKMHIQ